MRLPGRSARLKSLCDTLESGHVVLVERHFAPSFGIPLATRGSQRPVPSPGTIPQGDRH